MRTSMFLFGGSAEEPMVACSAKRSLQVVYRAASEMNIVGYSLQGNGIAANLNHHYIEILMKTRVVCIGDGGVRGADVASPRATWLA